MNLVEQLEFAYYNQEWDGVVEALKMLGVNVGPQSSTQQLQMPPTILAEGKISKSGQNNANTTKSRPKPPQPNNFDEFKTTRNESKSDWIEVSRTHHNTFVDTKEDKNEGPYIPKYKPGQKPKGVKKSYPSHDAYLQHMAELFPTPKSQPRPAVKKVKVTCDKCHVEHELYPSQIVYSSIDERLFICNDCSGK